ncbi:MAG: branched-chain amino acid ABC transporter permease [Methylobacteriaceae bacterium]|nr:branched-chain amino acid ABC transporter permease [Methylobacteriaceae bacterium]
MDLFAQLLLNGIVIGATYALIAVGLTLIFGMMRIVNFAHGEFYMLGAYFAVSAASGLHVGFFLALPLAVIGVTVVGWPFERFLLRRLRDADLLSSALLTIGFSIALQNVVLQVYGPKPAQVPDPFGGSILTIGPVSIATLRALTLAAALAAMALLAWILKYTKLGRTFRATFQARDAAALQGIEVDTVFSLAFAVGIALAAMAGALLSAVFVVSTDMGNIANLKSFAVVILGGLGNIPGAIIGGFLLGIAESLAAGYVSTGYKDGISFLLLILVLLVRPNGIFGRAEVQG